MFEEAAIGMATMTLTGHLVRTNRALAALLQRTPADLLGRFYGELTQGQGKRSTPPSRTSSGVRSTSYSSSTG